MWRLGWHLARRSSRLCVGGVGLQVWALPVSGTMPSASAHLAQGGRPYSTKNPAGLFRSDGERSLLDGRAIADPDTRLGRHVHHVTDTNIRLWGNVMFPSRLSSRLFLRWRDTKSIAKLDGGKPDFPLIRLCLHQAVRPLTSEMARSGPFHSKQPTVKDRRTRDSNLLPSDRIYGFLDRRSLWSSQRCIMHPLTQGRRQ